MSTMTAPRLRGTVSATKLRNAVARITPDLVAERLNNIRINGELRGCSGFFVHKVTGKVVYVNTEDPLPHLGVYYREARDTRDYTGGRNHFCQIADLPEKLVELATAGA